VVTTSKTFLKQNPKLPAHRAVCVPPCSHPLTVSARPPSPRLKQPFAGEKDILVQPESDALGNMLEKADALAKNGEQLPHTERDPLSFQNRASINLRDRRLAKGTNNNSQTPRCSEEARGGTHT